MTRLCFISDTHEQHRQLTQVNAATCDEGYRVANAPIVIDLEAA